MSTSPSVCRLNSVSAANGYQGKLVTIDVPIPNDYSCYVDDATGCWINVTTWSAAILGNPVRIVE